MSGGGALLKAAAAAGAIVRQPDSLPDPRRPAGTPTEALPFDHVIVVMMENHSFDNLLGALAHSGQPKAQGLKFNTRGVALNSNPGPEGAVRSFPFATTAQGPNVSQSWNATHRQIDGGKMDGFVSSVGGADQPMGYWTEELLPFPYSLARTFCVANRWFSAAPCQTYPNRRFLMAGTAYGNISTDVESLKDPPPPNGTIWDRLHHYEI
ncbi:MAG: Acid phosphatase, partial [Solirubrobacterales bacterium]|nr:Acid phosphatase [Solirubrobacterales bacterium]